jgi:hypothetical protein
MKKSNTLKPYKCGFWWFIGFDNRVEPCEIIDDGDHLSVVFLGDNRPHALEYVIRNTDVIKEWIRPAHPPTSIRESS